VKKKVRDYNNTNSQVGGKQMGSKGRKNTKKPKQDKKKTAAGGNK
jgi:hypothetical protein